MKFGARFTQQLVVVSGDAMDPTSNDVGGDEDKLVASISGRDCGRSSWAQAIAIKTRLGRAVESTWAGAPMSSDLSRLLRTRSKSGDRLGVSSRGLDCSVFLAVVWTDDLYSSLSGEVTE